MAVIDQNEIFGVAFEPKVKSRFIMYIEGIPAFMVHAGSRPTIAFEDITLDHINIKRKIHGKAEWQDITITLYDPIVPSAAQAVMEWVRLSHESVTGREGYADMYKKDITINTLGPPGDIVEEWILKGAYVKQAQFGDMSWSESAVIDVQLTIRYDYAILQF
jgi:hypothetical protein